MHLGHVLNVNSTQKSGSTSATDVMLVPLIAEHVLEIAKEVLYSVPALRTRIGVEVDELGDCVSDIRMYTSGQIHQGSNSIDIGHSLHLLVFFICLRAHLNS